MSYDERLTERLRRALADRTGLAERRMSGGLACLLDGNVCCGIVKQDLMVRVGPERHEAGLACPHARPMDFTGRALRGMVYVSPAGVSSDDVACRVAAGASFARTLPATTATARRDQKSEWTISPSCHSGSAASSSRYFM